MNKILFSTITGAVLLCSFGLTAQNQVTLSVPEISGAAYVTGDEINLRKLPSAKSPQLQFQQDAEDYEGSGEAVWSDTPTPRGYERRNAKLYKTNVIPVIQVSDGWVQTIYSNMTPWVKGDFCRLNPLQQVVPGMSDRYDDKPLSIRTAGAFKDWCAYYWDDEMGGTGIYLGHMVDKIAVLPMVLYCHPAFDEKVKGISIAEGEIRYGYDAYIDKGRPAINLDKLSDSDFSKLLSLAEPSQEEQIFYAFDETIFRESIHPDTYTGKLKRVIVDRESDNATAKTPAQASDKISTAAETAPSFPGGMGAMMSWLGQNMQYPAYAQSKNIQGRVIVRFVVLSDGSIGEIQLAKSIDPELDKEAVRLVKAMPRWTPGTAGGKAVNVWYTLPITFRLH